MRLKLAFLATALMGSVANAATVVGIDFNDQDVLGISAKFLSDNEDGGYGYEFAIGKSEFDGFTASALEGSNHQRKPQNDEYKREYLEVGANYSFNDISYPVVLSLGLSLVNETPYEAWHDPDGKPNGWVGADDYWSKSDSELKGGAYFGASMIIDFVSVGIKYDSAMESTMGSIGFSW